MRKIKTHNKLQLKLETVKALSDHHLRDVAGGGPAKPLVVHPTTTVQTYIC